MPYYMIDFMINMECRFNLYSYQHFQHYRPFYLRLWPISWFGP